MLQNCHTLNTEMQRCIIHNDRDAYQDAEGYFELKFTVHFYSPFEQILHPPLTIPPISRT